MAIDPRAATLGRPNLTRPREVGFTLIEVLAAVAVLSLVMVLLGQGLQFGLLSWSRQNSALAGVGDLDATDRLLRRLVGQIDPGGLYGTSAQFQGSSHALRFTSTLPRPLDGLASREADLLLEAGHDGLELAWRPHVRRLISQQTPPQTRQPILPGVVRLDLAYAGADGVWRGSWDNGTLPRLIRVHLVFASDQPRHWPDLMLAPMRDPWRP